jgi:AraC-like DNA-binding protein
MTSGIKNMTSGCNEQKMGQKMGKPSISAGYPRALLQFAVSKGANREALLLKSRIDPAELQDQDNRVPLPNYLALLEAAIEQCKEPALALLFGEEVRIQDISIVGIIGETFENFEAGREQLNRYWCLALDDGEGNIQNRIEFVPEGADVWLKFDNPIYTLNPLLVESGVARSVCGARTMMASIPALKGITIPKAIRFMHAEPNYRATYDRIFGVPLFFESSMNALLIDGAFVNMQFPRANPYLSEILTARAETLLEKLESSKSFGGRVEELLVPLLRTGDASMEIVSRKLGVSRQTLFRKLKAEGVTFEKILDGLRQKLAFHYVREKKIPVNEASYMLGFSDPASFSRAYKRWTGQSPSDAGRVSEPTI